MHEVMGWDGPVTHRQYVAWNEWLTDDLERPSRSDHYVMQLTERVSYVLATSMEGFDANRWKIKFQPIVPKPFVPDPPSDGSDEAKHRQQMAIAVMMLGGTASIRGGEKLAAKLDKLKE